MPMHDWTRVEAGIYHAFHSEWISQINRALLPLLPEGYYCLPEQQAAGFGPDIRTLQDGRPEPGEGHGGTATRARPRTTLYQETPTEFYLRKNRSVVIRHVSGDRIVAMIEVVSPGNKNSANGLRAFVTKVRELLQQKVHLLLIDPFPVSQRDPHGLHAAIMAEAQDDPLQLPEDLPLGLIAYECAEVVRTYLEPVAVGDLLPDMPVFLYPGFHLDVPLEATYTRAWEIVPPRWRRVIEAPTD